MRIHDWLRVSVESLTDFREVGFDLECWIQKAVQKQRRRNEWMESSIDRPKRLVLGPRVEGEMQKRKKKNEEQEKNLSYESSSEVVLSRVRKNHSPSRSDFPNKL